jgi:arylsulfatase A-like enzyme
MDYVREVVVIMESVDFTRTLAVAGVVSAGLSVGAAGGKPNIVFILADDLGYGDVRCYNPEGKIRTPNIDALAAQGMRFTDAHAAAAVCTPSRYGLLTGRYPWRTKLKRGVLTTRSADKDGRAGCEPLIAKNVLTVGEFLHGNGYATAAFGKWHLGLWYEFPKGRTKLQGSGHGAAAPVGTKVIEGPTARGFDVFAGYHHAREMGTWIEGDKVVANITPEEMLGRITAAAVAYVKRSAKAGKPFFMYVPFNSPHTPIVPTKEWKGKSGINDYADYVMDTDAAVGKIVAALDSSGLKGNTIVFFSSDNGCSPKANFKALLAAGHNPSGIFRGKKADIWEGGHRVPFIVRWPGVAKAGSVCADPICLTSLVATVADILGVALPKDGGVDSFSILADLKDPGNATPTHKLIIHQSSKGKLAIREGRWKFIACAGSGSKSGGGDGKPTQLYDLGKDPSEKHNVVDGKPEVVSNLKKGLDSAVGGGATATGKTGKNDTPVTIYGNSGKKRKKKR